MTVILNEAALKALLDTQEGPVGRFVEKQAGLVVAQTQQQVRGYFAGAPTLTVDQDVQFEMDGSSAVIGFVPPPDVSGNKVRRLTRQGLVEKWFRQALGSV